MTRVTAPTESPPSSRAMEAIDYAGLLDPVHLPDEHALDSSLRIIGQLLTNVNCIMVIDEILSIGKPQLTAVFLSGLDSTIPIEEWIFDNMTNVDYHPGLVVSRLLLNLSAFVLDLPILPLTEHPEIAVESARHDQEVQAAFFAMPTLISFCSRTRSLGEPTAVLSGMELIQTDNGLDDAVPFLVTLGIPIPTDPIEAMSALLQIIEQQKHLLSFYLGVIRMPEIRSEIMTRFISEPNEARGADVSGLRERRSVPPILKQSYYEAVNSFGVWKILISGRTDEDLRRWRRGDKEIFLAIVRKVRDLSRGDFSPNNQSRINYSGDDVVPIFEAKVVSDYHLIYQVDCLQETVTEVKQVIKIYGIYSPMECKIEFWDVVGKQLASKGKVYEDRCRYRVPLDRNSDQRYFIPAVFPPMTKKPVANGYSIADVLQNVHDREWLQTISVLQKFVPLSQALLHSIFADLDAIFPVDVSFEQKLIIEHPSSCYVLGRSGTGKTTTMLHKMLQIERDSQNNSGGSLRKRQIFITKSGILAEKVQEHFNTMLDSIEISNKSPKELKEIALSREHKPCADLVDKDEDADLHAPTLPGKFSDLQDKDFPLFLTFDRLCKLLAADLVGATDSLHPVLHANLLALNDPALDKEKFVSYDRFRSRHWRRHNQKGLDPYSVFNELLGVIEGSELAASSPQKCIDANTYESLSERGYSTFSNKRSIVYEIFQSYRKMKREMGEYDAADRTHALLHFIEILGVPGQKFDYIYIDEAQDNLMIDALLLRTLCCNSDGLFWAGDTAQTISSGCSFRFQDLKSMLYRVEQQVDQEIDLESSSKLPKTFSLTVNHRSHSGIANCAHSVVKLIQQFWPYSIDILAPEQGFFVGPLPVILAVSHSENIQFKQSHLGSRRESLEFGANQCIIVRNKEVKEQLKKHVGGNVLTIYESKGLEFNDVLLYNFFEDSTLEFVQWRLILKQELGRFDALKYIGLCTELKSLYVAITRAKKNLWIADCSEKAKPMKDYWLKRNLVHIRTIAEEDLLRLAETSTVEEWFDMGMMYFERKQYSEARSCFERASHSRERAIAHAYALREHASTLPTGKSAEVARRHAFLEAAEAFRSCSSKHNPVYSRRSGECFEAAEQYSQAAKAFYLGENYTKSVILYHHRLGKFDEAIAIILEKKDNVRQDVVDGVKDAAKYFYLSRAETNESALEKAKQLFDTNDKLLDYLDDMCLDGVRGTVLSSLGKYAEAIASFVVAGRYLDAIKLLLMDKNPDSTRQACTYIVQELWKLMPFGFRAGNVKSDNITKLLTLSDDLERSFLQFNERAEIEMFHEIYSNNHPALGRLGENFFEARNFPASAHCFEQIYHECLPHFEAMTLQQLAQSLRIFQMYVQAMFAITIQTDPRTSYDASRLFGFEIRRRNRFFLPKGTFFYTATEEHGFNPSRRMDEGFLINGETLGLLYRRTLEAHLKNLLLQENQKLCLHCPALDINPCINFLLQGNCRKPKGSCTRAHLRPSSFDSSWYNLRIHVHLIQISILQTLASLLDYQELNRHRRIWISRLYEALHPPLYLLGSLALFNPLLIPEYDRYLHSLKGWIRELAYDQSTLPLQLKFFMTNLLKSLDLSLTFDKDESCNYLYRAKFMAFPPIPDHLRSPHGTYVVFEAINSLRDDNRWPSSLTQGILFSKHVVDKCLPVDMGVLCNYLDFLCGQSVISASIQRHGVLHEVLLPRSWWIKLMIRPGCNANKSTRLSRLIVDVISSLLSQLLGNNKAEHLLHHSRAVNPESWQTTICWAYITRLCRAVCLLGHNLYWLKQSILVMFSRLSSLVDYISPLCSMYFQHHWSGIVVALHNGSHDLAREQLILVCNRHKVASARDMQQERYYRQLYYTDKRDLLAALQSNLHNQEKAQARGNIANNAVEAKDRLDPASHDIEEEVQEQYHDDSSQNRSAMQMVALTREEQEAGSIIRNAYRKYVGRKAKSMNSSARLTHSAFIQCLEQSRTVEWPRRSQYKFLYLGPLSNLLACLECVWADISDKRDDARKMSEKKLGHEALDQEIAKRAELSAHNKEVQRLREALGPKGNIHPSRDQAMLKSTVQEAVTFIRKFPNVAMGEMRWDLEAAEKGILKEKEKESNSRPELQYDDDDDLYY